MKFAAIVTLGLLVAALVTEAQHAREVRRVGMLLLTSPAASRDVRDAFLRGLHESGWVVGQNVAIEPRYAEHEAARLPALAAELVALKVDVVVTATGAAIRALKDATSTIPIVMAASGDPVREGLVASLARPGGNITGLTFVPGPEIVTKQLQLLKDLIPQTSRVALLTNPTNPWHAEGVKWAQGAARRLGIELHVLEVRSAREFDHAFAAITKQDTSALQVLNDAMFFGQRIRIAELAAAHRLPAMYGGADHVTAGGLLAYGASLRENFRRAALFVAKILDGANPADLPVEQPTKFELVINLKTAKLLGLTVPQPLLLQANEIIQ